MITFEETGIKGLKIIHTRHLADNRGYFSKIQNSTIFSDVGITSSVAEIYTSMSHKGVVRGLHFQNPPSAQSKIVFCLSGSIYDVAVDLRKKSPTYGKHYAMKLCSSKPVGLYVPEGFAHGLQSLEDGTFIINACSNVYDPTAEVGIKWDSCNIEWPIKNAIVSEKDMQQPSLNEFHSEF